MELVETLDKLGSIPKLKVSSSTSMDLITEAQLERIIKYYESDLEQRRIYQTYLFQKLELEEKQFQLDTAKEERLRAKSEK